MTDGSTNFQGGSCRSLRDGREVEVRGVYMSNGQVRAERVSRDDDDDDDDDDDRD